MTMRSQFEFVIEGSELNRVARWLDRLAPGRVQPGREYLSGIHVFAVDDSVVFSSTDLETQGVGITKAIVRSAGSTVISSRLLTAIAKTCKSSEEITFKDDGSMCSIQSRSASWRVPTISDQYWPQFNMRGRALAECDTEELATAFERISFAVSKDAIAPTWSGMVLEIQPDDVMRVVATDGYRLAVADVEATTETDERVQIIVPAKGFERAFSGSRDSRKTKISTSDSGLIVSGSGYRAFTRVAHEYPDWLRVFPKNHPTHAAITVDIAELKDALSRIAVMSEEAFPTIIEIDDSGFTVRADRDDKGDANAYVDAIIDGEPAPLYAFRAGYLADILRGCAKYPVVKFKFGERPTGVSVTVACDKSGEEVPGWVHAVRTINPANRKAK